MALLHLAHTLPTVAEQSSHPLSSSAPMNTLNGNVIETLMSTLNPILSTHQQIIVNHMVDLNASIVTLTQEISASKVQARQAYEFHRDATQTLLGRLDKLEKFIGTTAGGAVWEAEGFQNKSLMDRLNSIEWMASEMLERAKDFENSNTAWSEVRINATTPLEPSKEGASTRPEYCDTAIGTSIPLNLSPRPRHDENTRHDFCLESSREQSPHIALQSNALVPADWSSQSTMTSPNHSENDHAIESFIPDSSATTDQSPILLPHNRDVSPGGTVTSLRYLLLNEPSATESEGEDLPDITDRPNQRIHPTPGFVSPPNLPLSPLTSPQRLSTSPPVDACMLPLSPCTSLQSSSSRSNELVRQESPHVSPVITKPLSFGSLSPLSSISSLPEDAVELTCQDAKLQSSPNPIIPHPRNRSSGAKKRKARNQLTMPSPKRPRRKTATNRRKSTLKLSDVKWPEKSGGDDTTDSFHRNFILCDRCRLGYHCGCVGVAPGDIRLEPTEIYICPACDASNHEKATINSLPDLDQQCARPDCNQLDVGEFFVERIVGRKPKATSNDGEGQKYFWLVKWDGYTISEATWESEEQMADPLTLVADFNKAAEEEGFSPDIINTIILKEAVEGGWQSEK